MYLGGLRRTTKHLRVADDIRYVNPIYTIHLISTGTPTVLSEFIRWCPHFLQANAGAVP
jgi:hypothetical protein